MVNLIKEHIKATYADAKIAIWGFGKEGQSTYALLRDCFKDKLLYVCDDNPVELENVINIPVLELNNCDLVFKSPGIPVLDDSINVDHLTSQTDLFFQFYGHQTLAITGTKGKSTTSSLLAHILKENDYDVQLVGNIGIPCFNVLDRIKPNTLIVFEVSAHQLQFIHASTRVGVLLNLYEEHLDHYKDYDQYCQSKANLINYQKGDDLSIVNIDCIDYINKENVITSSNDEYGMIYAKDNLLVTPFGKTYVLHSQLVGKHNFYNCAIVYAICKKAFNMCDANFLYGLKTFQPLAHRLQLVGTFNGVTYYDDSISTVGQTTIAALQAIDNANTIIIGGMDRGIDYTCLIDYLNSHPLKAIYCMYATGKRIAKELNESSNVYVLDTLYDVVAHIKRYATVGDVVILSPAASSYDAFTNFEQRGNIFKKLVSQ